MSQFRPRHIARPAPRRRAAVTPIVLHIRCALRLTCSTGSQEGSGTSQTGRADERAGLPSLLSALSLLTSAALGLLALPLAARAQTTNVPHDVSLRFQTPDVAHPNAGAKLQSIWSANDPAGWTIQYDLTTGWNANTTFGSFKDVRTPKIDLGLFSIPAIDYGTFGAGGQIFTKAKDTGLRFNATATGGSVSVDYPVNVHLDAPRFIKPGATFNIHVTYTGDSAAKVSTLSPQAFASINLMLNAQMYVNGSCELFSRYLFNGDIIDWCNRNDKDSPKYNPNSSGSDNKGFNVNTELFNTNSLVSALVSKATYSFPPKSPAPYITASLNFPIINTLGQPGSSSNYQSGSGGTSTNTSYEYTTGITIPDEVKNNPNATYARAQDNVINLTADFTNMLTEVLELPPLNYTVPLGEGADISFGLLDLQANLGLGLLQEFAFVPKPKVHLMIGDTGNQTADYEIDPINGVDIPVQMPLLPPKADPNTNVSVKVTPIVSMPNNFISNTYLNLNGGLSLRPLYLELAGKGGIGSFSFDPLDLKVGVDIPYPIYKTTFNIPFNAQTGDAFYVTTQSPPLASLLSLSPTVLYVNENEISFGTGIGVSADDVTLNADRTYQSPNTFAGQWVGTINSGSGSATALTYSTKAYWDTVIESNRMRYEGLFNALNPPATTTPFTALWYLYYDNTAQNKVDLTPGIHHVYAANSAASGGSNFGPRITGLPLPVAYPKPTLEMLGARCAPYTPGSTTEFMSGHGLVYLPYNPVSYTLPSSIKSAVGPIVAGSPSFTLIAINHAPFNDPAAPNGPFIAAPWSVGSFSRIKFDGKLLTPDPNPVYNNFPTNSTEVYPFTSGQIPASMIAKAGYHTVQVSNPVVGGKGGDSNILVLHVVNPVPVITDVSAVQQNPIQGANVSIVSHQLVAGGPDTRLKITGSNLTPDSVAYWRDTTHPLATEFVNSGQIYATLPAALTTQPSLNHSVLVVNPRSTIGSGPVDGGTASSTGLHLLASRPAITNILANGAPINALDLNSPVDATVTVQGEHFFPGLTLNWEGKAALVTTFVDEHTLTAVVPASYLSRLGKFQFRVHDDVKGIDQLPNAQQSLDYNMTVVYGPPVLASLGVSPAITPPAIQVGAAAPTLALTGGLFYPGSTVTIGGQKCAVTFGDTTHLQAVVPTAMASAIGSYPVVVTNPASPNNSDGTPAGDGGVSSPLPFQVLKYAPQAQLSMTAKLTRNLLFAVEANLVLSNTGMADATNVRVTTATLGSTGTTDQLPLRVGNLALGQTYSPLMRFTIPFSARGTIQTLKLTGTMTTGGQTTNFSTSARVLTP